MSRLFFGIMLAFGLSICSFTVGCGGGGTKVIEQDAADIEAQAADYEKEMEAEAKRQLEESKTMK